MTFLCVVTWLLGVGLLSNVAIGGINLHATGPDSRHTLAQLQRVLVVKLVLLGLCGTGLIVASMALAARNAGLW